MSEIPSLGCTISTANNISGSVTEALKIAGELRYATDGIQVAEYTGAYSVTPAVEEQTLQTKDTILRDDVSIHKIPTYTVSNTYGGETFVIGEMSDYGD